ncbi:Disease resistance protein L6 [Linum perenne]
MSTSESKSSPSFDPAPLPLPSGEYEVFLSFRGPDVRLHFADHLYTYLVGSKIRTFRDEEELPKGEFIAPSLVKAITESKVYIPIFSQNYASSKCCLQELAKMVECWRSGGGEKGQHIILPVFYFIDPRDVRHPDSGSYKEAFEQHGLNDHPPETILEWKEALQEVGKMKGWHITESDGQGAIIVEIFSKVDIHLRANYTLVTDELVGIDSQVEDVVKLLNLDSMSEKIIGIHGMGGLGKTTLAKAVYNKVSTQFERCCFLDNIRDTLSEKDGVLILQNKIISGILRKDSFKAKDVNDGIRVIQERVSRQKLLIVLDDIDERVQFEDILGKLEKFSVDSRFIVTTRDTRVLELLQGCKLFELEEMSCDHALKLFSKHAFGVNYPLEDYASLSTKFVRVATGLPLYLKGTDYVEALEVNMKGENLVLRNEHLKELSRLRYMVLRNARLSGSFKDVLPNIRWLGLANCDSVPSDLNVKKLVVLQLEDCPVRDGWKGWNEIKVSRKLKLIFLCRCLNLNLVPDLSNCGDLECLNFKECHNMRGELDISNFKNLKLLQVSDTKITKLKGEIEKLQNLQCLDASNSSLIEVPAGISKLSSLELLNLRLTPPNKLEMTERLPNSLKRLAISSSSLSSLPSSLTILQIWYCEHLPNLANLTNLLALSLWDVSIGEILGLGELKLLEALNIERAPNLVNLDGLESLVLLEKLSLEGCTILEKLPSLAALSSLELLQIKSCPVITEIRVAEGLWESLSELHVRRCSRLTGIGALHCMVNLEILVLIGIGLTESVPSSLSMFTKLRTLSVSEWSLQQFPDLSNLKNLRDLRILNCYKLIQVTGLDTLESLELLRHMDQLLHYDLISEIADSKDRERYFNFVLRSYIEENRGRKWCPAPNCECAVEFCMSARDDANYNVSCLCSHSFCWNCCEDRHRPVDCETVKNWAVKNDSESENENWKKVNTKPCPKCGRAIEKNEGCMHMTCASPCHHHFCWVCLGPWQNHKSCNRYDEDNALTSLRLELNRYQHYYDRWAANENSRQIAMKDLENVRENVVSAISKIHGQGVGQVLFLMEAWEQIVECRRVLKWTYAYGFYLGSEEAEKKNFFEYLQGQAESCLDKLHDCAEKEMKKFAMEGSCIHEYVSFRMKLHELTKLCKTYFENLVGALENGLSDVQTVLWNELEKQKKGFFEAYAESKSKDQRMSEAETSGND